MLRSAGWLTSYVHIQTLAATRAKHWSEALAKCDKAKRKLALQRQLSAELTSKLQTLETQLASLKVAMYISLYLMIQRANLGLNGVEYGMRV